VYLPRFQREQADKNPVFGRGDPGVLSYRLTQALITWLGREPQHADFVAALGALEEVKWELQRRIVADRNDKVIERNGDLFPEYLLPEPVAEVTDDESEPEPAPQRYRI
jgi:hypothetical protein